MGDPQLLNDVYPKLKPEVKKAWLKALRRRKNPFKQTTGKLYSPCIDGYCCMGVLCEISGLNKLGNNYEYEGEVYDSGFPKLEWMYDNFSEHRSLEGVNTVVRKLSTMNDSEFLSFLQIANWIEKNL